jgi:hypothetical protein
MIPLVPTLLRGNASPTRCVTKSRQSNRRSLDQSRQFDKNSLDQLKRSDVTEFNSVTSLVSSDLLIRTACKSVRDTKISNHPPPKKMEISIRSR